MKIDLNIDNRTTYKIPNENTIQDAISKVLEDKNLTGDFEIDVKFVDKNEIQELNRKYRHIDKATDVLSFPIYNKVPSNIKTPILLGDIIICPDMAEEPIEKLIEHSTLHLLGFHHPDD